MDERARRILLKACAGYEYKAPPKADLAHAQQHHALFADIQIDHDSALAWLFTRVPHRGLLFASAALSGVVFVAGLAFVSVACTFKVPRRRARSVTLLLPKFKSAHNGPQPEGTKVQLLGIYSTFD